MVSRDPYAPPKTLPSESHSMVNVELVRKGKWTVCASIFLLIVALVMNAVFSIFFDTNDKVIVQLIRAGLFGVASFELFKGSRVARGILVVLGCLGLLVLILLWAFRPEFFESAAPSQIAMILALSLQVPLLLIPWFGVGEFQRAVRTPN